uniref:Nerve growth factor receptor a (TNFR superfamily, member 16) n=1 Tax=Oryzias sinensis TaxID=183150 RepID=A0A8C7Z5T6_9TELE
MSSILRKMLKAKKHRSWSIDFLQCVIFSLTPALLILFSAGETFSESYSLTEKCMPCTQCVGLMRMVAPCTDISDAKCQCDYNFYFNPLSDRCERCTVCPRGQGVYSQCDHDQDTVCEDCVDETYSDQDSSVEPCLPCTICEEDLETLESECTPTTDAVCFITFRSALIFALITTGSTGHFRVMSSVSWIKFRLISVIICEQMCLYLFLLNNNKALKN